MAFAHGCNQLARLTRSEPEVVTNSMSERLLCARSLEFALKDMKERTMLKESYKSRLFSYLFYRVNEFTVVAKDK